MSKASQRLSSSGALSSSMDSQSNFFMTQQLDDQAIPKVILPHLIAHQEKLKIMDMMFSDERYIQKLYKQIFNSESELKSESSQPQSQGSAVKLMMHKRQLNQSSQQQFKINDGLKSYLQLSEVGSFQLFNHQRKSPFNLDGPLSATNKSSVSQKVDLTNVSSSILGTLQKEQHFKSYKNYHGEGLHTKTASTLGLKKSSTIPTQSEFFGKRNAHT
jgi:hypothetical protein